MLAHPLNCFPLPRHSLATDPCPGRGAGRCPKMGLRPTTRARGRHSLPVLGYRGLLPLATGPRPPCGTSIEPQLHPRRRAPTLHWQRAIFQGLAARQRPGGNELMLQMFSSSMSNAERGGKLTGWDGDSGEETHAPSPARPCRSISAPPAPSAPYLGCLSYMMGRNSSTGSILERGLAASSFCAPRREMA